MATRTQLRQELLRRVLGPTGYHTGTATTASAVGTLDAATDPRLRASLFGISKWADAWIYRPNSTDSTDATRLCTVYSNAGTFTPAYNWTVSPAAEAFELIKDANLHPDEVHRCIERALRRMYHEVWTPLSLVANADMESTTGWTGTGATVSYDTAAGSSPEMGTQSLQVVTTAADGYAQSGNVRVDESLTYHLWVDARAPAATARITVRDVTNSKDIANDSWADGDWGTVGLSFTPGAGCDNIALRLGADATGATVHFDNAILLQSGRRSYSLPSWLTNPRQWIYQALRASWSDGPRRRRFTPIRWDTIQDETAANPSQVYVDWQAAPIFIRAIRPYLADTGTLAAEATVVAADLDWVVKCAELQVYDLLRVGGNVLNAQIFEARVSQALVDKRAMDAAFMPKRPSEAY